MGEPLEEFLEELFKESLEDFLEAQNEFFEKSCRIIWRDSCSKLGGDFPGGKSGKIS